MYIGQRGEKKFSSSNQLCKQIRGLCIHSRLAMRIEQGIYLCLNTGFFFSQIFSFKNKDKDDFSDRKLLQRG